MSRHQPSGHLLKASLREEPVDTFLSLPGHGSKPSRPPAPLNPLPGSQTQTPHLPPRRALILLDGSMLPAGPDHPRASGSISGPTASPLNPSAHGDQALLSRATSPRSASRIAALGSPAHIPPCLPQGPCRGQLGLLTALHLQGPLLRAWRCCGRVQPKPRAAPSGMPASRYPAQHSLDPAHPSSSGPGHEPCSRRSVCRCC